jgi:hypothetical protein
MNNGNITDWDIAERMMAHLLVIFGWLLVAVGVIGIAVLPWIAISLTLYYEFGYDGVDSIHLGFLTEVVFFVVIITVIVVSIVLNACMNALYENVKLSLQMEIKEIESQANNDFKVGTESQNSSDPQENLVSIEE